MGSPIVPIKLLQKLLKRVTRQDKQFDKYQHSFLQKLQNSSSNETNEELYEECFSNLSSHHFPIEDVLSEGRLTVSQSQLQLQKLPQLSELTAQKVENSIHIAQPYSILEHHSELTNIIKIYQRVVIELNKNKNNQATKNSPPLIHNICDELQLVIINLDVGSAYIKKLDAIRRTISHEEDPLTLPKHCLDIIAIIIDSTREERRSSRHFLFTLNDSLAQFYLSFAKNIKLTESSFENQEKCIKDIQKKSEALKEMTENTSDLSILKTHIVNYVQDIEGVFQEREEQKEQKVRQQLQGMARQIKELQNETNNYQKTLKQQSKQLHMDFLTKVANRAAWSERLEIEYARYQRYKHPLNIAIVDIDKFKIINDSFGHLAGDKVLHVIAQTLQKTIRNTDFIARYGGEEFALLFPEITSEQTKYTLEKLCQTIKNIPFKFKKEYISITISVGCTSFSDDDDLDSVFERADQALYQAKNTGRNQVIFFDKKS